MKNQVSSKYPTDGVIRAYVCRRGAETLLKIFDEHGKLALDLKVPTAEVAKTLEDNVVEKAIEIR